MDAITHLLVGRLLAASLGPEAGALGLLATAFAVLPDADTVVWAVPRLRRHLAHRGATHSLLFGALASLAAGAAFAWAGLAPFGVAFLVAFVAFGTHVALDVLNWGCALLWPFSSRRIHHTVHAGLAWSAGVSLASLTLLEATLRLAPAHHGALAAAMGALFAAYLALRLVLRAVAGRAHGGRPVLPTGNPLVWVLATERRR